MPGSIPEFNTLAEVVYKPLGDKGEDAFAYSFEKPDIHTLAVFDGCGGAGSWEYAEFKHRTGAFVSAQSLAKAYLSWFGTLTAAMAANPQEMAASFRDMAWSTLTALKKACAPMGVTGSLVKAFPSTVSAAVLLRRNDCLQMTTMNVGDSRVYLLSPEHGLVQLTVDDSDGNPDPMQSLLESAPLSDMLNADKPFSVKSLVIPMTGPFAVLCATDGVFGYFRSPMDFEHVILDTLEKASSFAGFEGALKEQVMQVTGDDSIALMAFYGWESFQDVQEQLASRNEYVSGLTAQLDEAARNQSLEETIASIWEIYRKQTLIKEMQEKNG